MPKYIASRATFFILLIGCFLPFYSNASVLLEQLDYSVTGASSTNAFAGVGYRTVIGKLDWQGSTVSELYIQTIGTANTGSTITVNISQTGHGYIGQWHIPSNAVSALSLYNLFTTPQAFNTGTYDPDFVLDNTATTTIEIETGDSNTGPNGSATSYYPTQAMYVSGYDCSIGQCANGFATPFLNIQNNDPFYQGSGFLYVKPNATTTPLNTISLEARIFRNPSDTYARYFDQACVDLTYEEPQYFQIGFTASTSRTVCIDIPEFAIPQSGFYTLNATTSLSRGLWSAVWSFYDVEDNLHAYATTTAFVVASSSLPLDYLGPDFYYGTTSPLEVPRLKNCNLTSFDLSDCFASLFSWQPLPMKNGFYQLVNTFKTVPPVGYVTRTIAIISSEATSSLPVLSYTFSSSFPIPAFASSTISFNIWDKFYSTGSLLKTVKSDRAGSSSKDIWELTEDAYTYLIYLALLWLIISRILSLKNNNDIS